MYRVVDTNVLIVANSQAPQASPQCVLNCLDALERIQAEGVVVIDSRWFILSEYENKVSPTGQPGPGDRFFKWVLQNLGNPNRCQQVTITCLAEHEFVEFPASDALQGFDPSDKKFVAVAWVHPQRPEIANAVDSDWWHFATALGDLGIHIDFLCSPLDRQTVK